MSMVTSREVPWMTLGRLVDGVMSAEEAIHLGGLDFTVSMKPCFYQTNKGTFRRSKDRNWVVRDDTEELFEVVSSSYELLQYGEAFEFLDAINPEFVAAGTLKGGKQGFVVIKAPETNTMRLLGDDPHDLYVVVRTSHDRSRAVEAMVMPLRQRCMNQLGLASFTRNVVNRWSIPHTSSMKDKLAVAQDAILKMDLYARELNELADRLAAVEVSNEQAQRILRDNAITGDRPKSQETRDVITNLWQHGETVGYAGTGWGLVNAVSDYFDWGRSNGTPESRFVGALSGPTYRAVNATAKHVLALAV